MFIFIVTSVLHSKSRTFYSSEKRLEQVINTSKSIKEHCKDSFSVLVEGSDISQEWLSLLKGHFDHVITPDSATKNACSNLHVSIGDAYLLIRGLEYVSTIKQPIMKVFKLSGRYLLTPEFNRDTYPNDKYGFGKLNDTDKCYLTVLFSIPIIDINNFLGILRKLHREIIEYYVYDKIKDVVVLPKLGFEGNYGANGTYITK